MKSKHSWEDIKEYFIATFRYKVYCSRFYKILRTHILQQYRYRVLLMREACYNNGSCEECGCLTPNLQFTNKSCKGKCYPVMMNKAEWLDYIANDDMLQNHFDEFMKSYTYVESTGKRFRRS